MAVLHVVYVVEHYHDGVRDQETRLFIEPQIGRFFLVTGAWLNALYLLEVDEQGTVLGWKGYDCHVREGVCVFGYRQGTKEKQESQVLFSSGGPSGRQSALAAYGPLNRNPQAG